MWPYRHSGAGRREFRRVVLTSLVKSARGELDERRRRGQRLRAHRALRRLEELEQQLAQLEELGTPLPKPWYLTAGAEMATAAACLVALAALAAAVAANGTEGVLVGVLDVVMLVATVGWFLIAVARRGSDVVTRHPSFEGSTDPAASR
jgi:hypothetical protein